MPKHPSVSFLFLADGHRDAERGKVDAQGIFNQLGVWAVPTSRDFSVVLGLSDIPAGTHEFAILLEPPRGEAVELTTMRLRAPTDSPGLVSGHRVSARIEKMGSYKIAVRYRGGLRNSAYLRLMVVEKKWPVLPTGIELRKVLARPNIIRAARAVLTCPQCKTEYIFQVNLDPGDPLPKEAMPFPPSGKFECPECGQIHYTKDTEGQVTSQLAQVRE